jgi:hypothetical protein
MATFAYLRKAGRQCRPFIDDTIPAGHFALTTEILGVTATYLLSGVLGDPAAPIVGRIEHHATRSIAYRGNRIGGGVPLPAQSGSAAAFRLMVNGARR